MSKVSEYIEPCGWKPNCVCSLEDRDEFFMEPIAFKGESLAAVKHLKDVLSEYFEARLEKEEGPFLHFVFVTPTLRFRDDVKFYFDEESHQLHFRSASRLGIRDFDANRKRIKKLKEILSLSELFS